MPYLLYGRKWWTWISSISSSIPLERCSKQAPIEGVLLCGSFSLLHVFQSRHVSSPYFCVLILTLLEENHRWSENYGIPSWISHLRIHKQIPAEIALLRWSLMSAHVFQTKSGSSTCYSFFVLKLMREIFVAYAISKSPLAFPICRAINGFL